jgi:hypothetical protein
MPTLSELGITITGNYVTGERTGVVLSQEGAAYFNGLYLDKKIEEGASVEIFPKILDQGFSVPMVSTNIAGYGTIIDPKKDNFFEHVGVPT